MDKLDLLSTYTSDTSTLLNQYDSILKKRNSIGFLDHESLEELFRIMHSIKASSGMLELDELVKVAHSVENILDYLRKFGNSCMSHSTIIELLFKTEYYFRSRLKNVLNKTPKDDFSEFKTELDEFVNRIPAQNRTPLYDPNKKIEFERMFDMMERTINNMANKLDKKVILETSGEHTQARREIIDGFTIPVLHLIRNAMDHGIESPKERLELGKPECGVISITVGEQEDVIFVTVANDGRNLDINRILELADHKRLLKKPKEDYSQKEIANFILVRGFTTKGNITEYSGRGIGLSIVKSCIQNMGGTLFINQTDYGLSVTLAVPEDKEKYA